ncbi:MAG: hypothetical protein KDD44_05670, partial [Bdellovibrionales bacterium]|nr:hypothetical protein [Bdellovibrionales bacterium]
VLLRPPGEEEFEPIVRSILERRNMVVSEFSLRYLLRRLPRRALSIEEISAKISALSFAESRPAGLGVIRDVLRDTKHSK